MKNFIRIKPGVLLDANEVLCVLHDPEEEEGQVTIGLTHGKSVTTKKHKLAYSMNELERAIIESRDPRTPEEEQAYIERLKKAGK